MKARVMLSTLCLICLAGLGCSGPPVREAGGRREGIDGYGAEARVKAMPSLANAKYAVMDGTKDVQDLYLSTVKVEFGKDGRRFCSGVLVNPYLVFTAAHCFCEKNPLASAQVINGRSKTCAMNVSAVRAVFYRPTKDRKGAGSDGGVIKKQSIDLSDRYEVSQGPMEVELHPDYRVEFNSSNQLVESRADLAAIHLTQPILGATIGFQVPPPHEAEVGDVLLVVGYGKTLPENGKGLFGQRYYGSNSVKLVSSWADPKDQDGKVRNGLLVFQGDGAAGQKAHILEGDSGGPCFSQGRDGAWLVGINSIAGEPDQTSPRSSIFTSTFVYREWIGRQKAKSEERIEALKSRQN